MMNPKYLLCLLPMAAASFFTSCQNASTPGNDTANGTDTTAADAVSDRDSHSQPLSDGLTRLVAHDPVIATQGDTIYAFSTGRGIIQMHTVDMKTWVIDGSCVDELPQWVKEHNPDASMHLWAPDIVYANGLWHLYYCSSVFGKNISVIGHLTNKTLNRGSKDYKWQDRGLLLESIPHRDFWNAIDPNVVLCADGSAWMTFGSFWGGIKLVRLDSSLGSLAEPQKWYTIASRQRVKMETADEPGDAAIEAPYIFKRGGWFYLFVSFDYCCRGENSTYHVVCGRSRDVYGPYEDKTGMRMDMGGGTRVDISEADSGRYVAAGHCAVVSLRGHDYMALHGYPRNDGPAELMIRKINWTDDGWPVLE